MDAKRSQPVIKTHQTTPDESTSRAPGAVTAQTCYDDTKQHIKWWQWHEPRTTKREKWLIFKLDLFILSYTCLTFFVKYLDQTNITNAYISGMKQDLHMRGDELNWIATYFNIGIIVGSILGSPALVMVEPRWWLPFCTTCWSLLVLFMYKAEAVTTLYILRFFAGCFEASVMPSAFYIIGSWYSRTEIARRTTLFWFSSVGGQMISSYIQAGLYHNMDGRLGLRAWRWLFILDFVISIPVVILGFCCCPGQPKSNKIWWMTEEEKESRVRRLAAEGRSAISMPWKLSTVKNIVTSWQFYGFSLAWGFMQLTCGTNLQRWITLYLDSLQVDGKPKYDVELINVLPTIVGCTALAWMVLSAIAADRLLTFPWVIAILGSVQLFGYIVLSVWPSNESFILAVYYISSAYSAISPQISSWLNTSCGENNNLRAISNGFMIALGYAFETVAQQTMFPVSDAPTFHKTHGYEFGAAWITVLILWCSFALPFLERYYLKARVDTEDEGPSTEVESRDAPTNMAC